MASAHDMHLLSGYQSYCAECVAQREADEAEREQQNDNEIDRLTCEFANKTAEAARAVFEAHRAVTALVSNSVYDIELAEGWDGPDALHELEVAARALRNAERIAKWRRDLLLASDPRMQERAILPEPAPREA
jgi:hypothetical protein